MNCKICGRESNKLGNHLKVHKISPKDYFIKYLNNGITPVCYCGNETKFINLNKGFLIYCSSRCSTKSKETQEKMKQTCFKNNGVEHPLQSKKIREKFITTCLERFGEEHSFQSEEVKESIKKTCREKFGFENPTQNEKVKNKVANSLLEISFYNLINGDRLKNKVIPLFSKEEYRGNKDKEKKVIKYKWGCKTCGNEFEGSIANGRIPRCSHCFPIEDWTSFLEKEVLQEVKILLFNKFNKLFIILENDRKILKGKEIDILIPELNLSIEVNGDYWHRTKKVKKRDKWKEKTMKEKGYKHLVIKECDWKKDKNLVLQELDDLLDKEEKK